MTYDELLHCIRAVTTMTNEDTVYLFGSQSPAMFFGDLPEYAGMSMESDIMTQNNSVSNSYMIDGNLGEDSDFQQTFGLVVDGVIDSEISLAPDWESRSSTYQYDIGDKTINIIVPSPEDIAVAKLMAEREKDRLWLESMIDAELLDIQRMSNIIYLMEIPFAMAQQKEKLFQTVIDHTSISWE